MVSGNDNQKRYYEPIVYSPYGSSNTDGIDPSAISYTFYNGLLKIAIAPMKAGAKPTDKQIWDHDNEIAVWLTHQKASVFAEEIKYVLSHPDEINNSGVATGSDGLISFSNGKEFGVAVPCLVIRKIDPENGSVQSVYVYQFKDAHYNAIRNFDPSNPSNYDKVPHVQLEVNKLITILEDYARYISGAAAYSSMYYNKYDTSRMNTKIGLIMDKLGIEQNAEYSHKNNNGGNRSFFTQSNNGGSNAIPSGGGMRTTTIQELMGDE